MGSFLSWALTATTDKKMIKYHGLNHNPIHIPSCSAECKKAASEDFFFPQPGSSNGFLISLHISLMCVCKAARLRAWNPFTVYCVSECSTKSGHDGAVNASSGSKNPVRQFRMKSPIYSRWISFGWATVESKHIHAYTICRKADLVHRDRQSAVTFPMWSIWAPMKMEMAAAEQLIGTNLSPHQDSSLNSRSVH